MLVLKGRSTGLNALWFSPDGNSLVAAGTSGFVQVWDLRTNTLASEVSTGMSGNKAAFVVGEELLALHDEHLKAFSLATGKQVRRLPKGDRRPVMEAALKPGGTSVAVGYHGMIVQACVADGEREWATARGEVSLGVTSIAYSGNGWTIAAGLNCGVVMLFNARTGEHRTSVFTETLGDVGAVALSPNGRLLAGCTTNSLYLWRPDRVKQQVAHHSLGKTHFLGVAWHPSGDFFATANGDGKVDYWSAATGERRESFDWGIGKLHDVTFDASGDRAACCSKTGKIVIWDIDR